MDQAGVGIHQELQIVDEPQPTGGDSGVKIRVVGGQELGPRHRQNDAGGSLHGSSGRTRELQGCYSVPGIAGLATDAVAGGRAVGEPMRNPHALVLPEFLNRFEIGDEVLNATLDLALLVGV